MQYHFSVDITGLEGFNWEFNQLGIFSYGYVYDKLPIKPGVYCIKLHTFNCLHRPRTWNHYVVAYDLSGSSIGTYGFSNNTFDLDHTYYLDLPDQVAYIRLILDFDAIRYWFYYDEDHDMTRSVRIRAVPVDLSVWEPEGFYVYEDKNEIFYSTDGHYDYDSECDSE